MKVLVACEYSGTVRDAFIRAGHDATKPPSQWQRVETCLPDDDQAVLIALAGGEVWTGYMDAGEWRYISGDTMESKVTHWMDMPEPPL